MSRIAARVRGDRTGPASIREITDKIIAELERTCVTSVGPEGCASTWSGLALLEFIVCWAMLFSSGKSRSAVVVNIISPPARLFASPVARAVCLGF
jgi:hypothetical protein